MDDLPLTAATASVWVYWFIVGAMSWRVRRRTRRFAGVVPQQGIEKAMWVLWVPMVLMWMALPMIAGSSRVPQLSVPAWARAGAYANLRGAAGIVALAALFATIECWLRMGRSWRMAVTPGERTELVTGGLYRSIRHPIYSLSILLVAACAIVLPTLPMLAVALANTTLLNLKARNEERHLLDMHGETYAAYLRSTGRFLPRLFAGR